jgi:hypothetical protein
MKNWTGLVWIDVAVEATFSVPTVRNSWYLISSKFFLWTGDKWPFFMTVSDSFCTEIESESMVIDPVACVCGGGGGSG